MSRLSALAMSVVLLTAIACGNDTTDVPVAGDPAIRGVVLLGPQCPVAVEDSPCPDLPWEGTVRVSNADGTVTDVLTDAQGRFTVSVGPGTYDVEPVVDGLGFARPERVKVTGEAVIDITLTVDSGIR